MQQHFFKPNLPVIVTVFYYLIRHKDIDSECLPFSTRNVVLETAGGKELK